MYILTSEARYPLHCISCGNLVSDNGFLHAKRNIDSFVLIVIQKGILHINVHGENCDVGPNQFIILFPNQTHYGYKETKGLLSYYWVHFYLKNDPNYKIFTNNKKNCFDQWKADPNFASLTNTNIYFLPERGELSCNQRVNVLFKQLLDMAERDSYVLSFRFHYALSILALEITWEYINKNTSNDEDIPEIVVHIIDWIRLHYNQTLTVTDLAERFNYNPNYLSRVFRESTGYCLKDYINNTRIAIAKNILTLNSVTVKEVACLCGIHDEKYFMKIFKKIEGITPSQYRKAFTQCKINCN